MHNKMQCNEIKIEAHYDVSLARWHRVLAMSPSAKLFLPQNFPMYSMCAQKWDHFDTF